MTRVMLLVPVLLGDRHVGEPLARALGNGAQTAQARRKLAVPWFALGFLALVIVNSLHVLPEAATSTLNTLDTFALTMAMTALGMETRIRADPPGRPACARHRRDPVCMADRRRTGDHAMACSTCSAERCLRVPIARVSPARSTLMKGQQMEHGARTQNEKLEVKTTTCYMCACRCGIRVHLRDGEVRYIDGNPDHPLNQGVICAKGASGIMKQYSPARLTQPLLRKPGAERGSAQFEPISWEAAFDDARKAPRRISRHRSEEVRALHRPRPDAGADRPLRAAVRHAQLRGARRLLLGRTWPPA